MIDVMENKILGPAILKGLEQGREEGRQVGRQEGVHDGKLALLRELLTAKFGPLPDATVKRLAAASTEDFDKWAKRILTSESLDDTFR